MGAVVFSDVHADAAALHAMRECIRAPQFTERFGQVDVIVNLGDLLHRGNRPKETLEIVHDLAREYRLVSVMGNHDHAFLNGLSVSGSDAANLYRHEQLRSSPLLGIFAGMPMEWVHGGILFVHGGPLELGNDTLRLKCWQRLGCEPGETFAGYYFTPEMAFCALEARGLLHLCCGHQHESICCRSYPDGIRRFSLSYDASIRLPSGSLGIAAVPLDLPAILRVGACFGAAPEFAFTDFSTFWFLRLT